MIAALRWLLRRVGRMTLLIVILLAIGLASLDWTLSRVVRGLDLELLVTLTLVGAVTGWLLARTRMQPLLATLLGILIALVTALIRVGQLGDRLLALLGAVGRTLWGAQFGQFYIQALSDSAEALFLASLTLVSRVQDWTRALAAGQPSYEPVALALVWSFVVCLVAAWAAWKLRRAERAFEALLPLVILLTLVCAYSGFGAWVIFVLLGIWFGLMVAVPYVARQRGWEKEGVPFAEDLGFDLALVTVPAIMVILTVAVAVPVISPQAIARWVRQWTESTPASARVISNSFGIEAAPRPPTALDLQSSPGLPRSHLLGASPDLLNKLALTVQMDEATQDLPVHYWLGTTYDEYTGHGWFSSGFREQNYEAGERVSNVLHSTDQVLLQTVLDENASGIVYAAGMVESVDRAFQVAWRQPDDMFGARVDTNSYQVDSVVPGLDANVLRAAGQAYPTWIRTQYMRVPDSMPPRVLALARDLTATEPTPYDRARALELYLRTIPYSLDVPLPPGDRDVVDYFLFDLRRGYCDYYATTMAMLARAAGLPARVAVGYAAGEYDAETHTYRVIEADAHSWTQVYFPNYGWVDFEPTSGRAAIALDAPSARRQIPPDARRENTDSFAGSAQRTLEKIWFVVPGILLLAGLLVLGGFFVDTLLLRRSAPTQIIRILYGRLIRIARLVGLPLSPGLTPTQIRALLEDSFTGTAGKRTLRWWQPIARVLQEIVAGYMETTYGAQALSNTQAALLIRKWQAVRFQFALLTALNILKAQGNALVRGYHKRFRRGASMLPHQSS